MMKIIMLLFWFSVSLIAVECERVKISTPCYAECGSFIDENSNKICDVWEKENKKKSDLKSDYAIKNRKEMTLPKQNAKVLNKTEVSQTQKSSSPKKEYEKFFRYGLIWIFLWNIILIIIGDIFLKSYYIYLRIFWNWVLLLACGLCALSGFFMYFNIFIDFKKIFFSLHIQTAVISSVTGFYHTYKRFKCLIKK